MKRDSRNAFLIAAVAAFCLGFSGVACIATGFGLSPVNLWAVGGYCALFALAAGALVFLSKRGWLYLGMVLCLGLGFFWREGSLELSLEALLERISSWYHKGYGTPVIRWSWNDLTEISPDMALCLVATLVMLAVLATLRYRKSMLLALPVSLLPLASCLVLTDTVPDRWCLMLLIGAMLLLALTNMVRRRSLEDGNRLTALLLIPSLLLTAVLFRAVPEGRPDLAFDVEYQDVLGMFQDLPFIQMDSGGSLHIQFEAMDRSRYDLSSVGPKRDAFFRVMTVKSHRGGILYLRGQAYDFYDGKAWSVSDSDRRDYLPPDEDSLNSTGFWVSRSWRTQGMTDVGDVTVSTVGKHPLFFTPYFLGEEDLFGIVGGRIPNRDGAKAYLFTQYLPEGSTKVKYSTMSVDDRSAYTQVPETSRSALWYIVQQALAQYRTAHGISLSVMGSRDFDILIPAIEEYVRGSAEYNLQTPVMPEEAKDFALWFLNESDRGYCIHFATAAVMLLRAAGVPARLVTGYALEAAPGRTTDVTADKSHAWVEYFIGANGWQIMDPTPGSVGDPEFVPTVTPKDPNNQATQPIWPDETTLPTIRPTKPTTPDKPTEVTEEPTSPSTDPTTSPTEPSEPGQEVDLSWIKAWLEAGCLAVLTACVIWGQAELRRWLRRRRWKEGPINARAIGLWRELCYRCKVLRMQPEPHLEEIAEKAKFSQHTISREEWTELKEFLHRTEQRVNSSKWYLKIVWYLVFAI